MTIKLNDFGYYEVANKPTQAELQAYYSQKYYQQENGNYRKSYPEDELLYFKNKDWQKYSLFKDLITKHELPQTLLDVGCGEGFTMSFFKEWGWVVKGLDYSRFGMESQNPDCLPCLMEGDIAQNLDLLIQNEEKFSVVWLDNVLEHVIDPLTLLAKCANLANEKGILVIEVPNDFSIVQNELKKRGWISRDFWIALPDHLSYFNRDGLSHLANAAGWEERSVIADFPIDFNLFNPDSNYIEDKTKGKGAHQQRVSLENLFHSISPEKTVALYEAMAEMGLGRQIVAAFQKK